MRTPEVEALAAKKSDPRRSARDRKADRERAMRLTVPGHARRIDADFVRKWPQCRKDACAAYDDAGIGLAHDLQGRAFLQVEDAGNGAAALQIDQRVREGQIVFTYVLVIAPHVLGEFWAAMLPSGKIIGGAGPGGV